MTMINLTTTHIAAHTATAAPACAIAMAGFGTANVFARRLAR